MTRQFLQDDEAKAVYAELGALQLAAIACEVDRVPREIAVLQKEEETLVGGAYGFLHPGWLYVDMVWVAESHRGKGLGSELLQALEEKAMHGGMHSAYLWTQDFEAPLFYEKHGYHSFATLPEFVPGHTRIGLWKHLIGV